MWKLEIRLREASQGSQLGTIFLFLDLHADNSVYTRWQHIICSGSWKKNICRDGEQEFCVPKNVQLSPQRKLIKIKTENNKNLPSLVGIFLSVYTIVVTVNSANENYYNARTTEFPSVIFYSRSKAETAVPSSQRASVATMLVGFFCKLLYEIVNVDCSVDARIETLGGNNVALSNAIYRLPITTQRHFDWRSTRTDRASGTGVKVAPEWQKPRDGTAGPSYMQLSRKLPAREGDIFRPGAKIVSPSRANTSTSLWPRREQRSDGKGKTED